MVRQIPLRHDGMARVARRQDAGRDTEIIALLGGVAAWPVVVRAQPPPVIGMLSSGTTASWQGVLAAMRQGLRV